MDPYKVIERQRVTITALVLVLLITAGYGVLETRREQITSLAAGTYWEDLYQEREDRKRDLVYIRSLEAKVAADASLKRQTPAAAIR